MGRMYVLKYTSRIGYTTYLEVLVHVKEALKMLLFVVLVCLQMFCVLRAEELMAFCF